jgi:hypothetical protein
MRVPSSGVSDCAFVAIDCLGDVPTIATAELGGVLGMSGAAVQYGDWERGLPWWFWRNDYLRGTVMPERILVNVIIQTRAGVHQHFELVRGPADFPTTFLWQTPTSITDLDIASLYVLHPAAWR